jgi:hypothetical protein
VRLLLKIKQVKAQIQNACMECLSSDSKLLHGVIEPTNKQTKQSEAKEPKQRARQANKQTNKIDAIMKATTQIAFTPPPPSLPHSLFRPSGATAQSNGHGRMQKGH